MSDSQIVGVIIIGCSLVLMVVSVAGGKDFDSLNNRIKEIEKIVFKDQHDG